MVKKSKVKKVVVELDEITVRQFFYINEKFEEGLIKTLERTYKENKKTSEEWKNLMAIKKISF